MPKASHPRTLFDFGSASRLAQRSAGWCIGSAVTWVGLLEPQVALAQAESETATSPAIEVHGFVSQGFIQSTQNEYLAKSKRGSFEFTEVGLNFTKNLGHDLRFGVQLFAHDLGPIGNYTPQFDWYYLDYRFWDWLGIRVGRTKMPYGLYNEINDIDVARVPILLPQSIYPVDHREFLFAQTGAELYGEIALGSLGAFEYRAYGGTVFAGASGSPPAPGVTVTSFDVPYVFGGRALWSTPIQGLQAGVSGQALRFDSDFALSPELLQLLQILEIVPADLTSPLAAKFRVRRWVASIQYAEQ